MTLDLVARLRELDITGPVAESMLAEPERALAIVERALAEPGIRNRAAYAVAAWRSRAERQRLTAFEPEPTGERAPPSVSALEYAWSRDAWPALKIMAVAIANAGGFDSIRRSFAYCDRYSASGERVSREYAIDIAGDSVT